MSNKFTVLDFQDENPDRLPELSASVPGRDIFLHYVQTQYAQSLYYNPDYVLTEQHGGDLEKYAEILTDDQVYATFQQRRQAVTAKEWDVSPGAEGDARAEQAADLLREHLKAGDWDQTTDKMLYGIFFGYSVAELLWELHEGYWRPRIKVRRRDRFEFGENDSIFLRTMGDPIGEPLPREKFWIFRAGADNDDLLHGRGLAHYLHWPTLFKRQGVEFWLIYLDKYAMPTVMGQAPPGKIQDRVWVKKALETLMSVQTDSAVVLSEELQTSLLEAQRSGAVDYTALYEAMNSAISKVVLSQTMTTDPGGGGYKGEVHMEVREEVIASDADQLNESFNDFVVRQWTNYNFGPEVPAPRVYRRTEAEENLNETAERDERLYNIGWQMTDQRVIDTYGDGYERRIMQAPFQPGTPLPGILSGNAGPTEPVTPQEFAEALQFAGMPPLAERRLAHRGAQGAMGVASNQLAGQYEDLVGPQIDAILRLADESESIQDFADKLPDMIAADPNPVAVETIQRATLFSRVLAMAQQGRQRANEDAASDSE